MTAGLLIVLLVALLAVGAGALMAARRRPGLRSGRGPERRNGLSGPNGAAIDPFAVSEPWRRFMQHALQAQDRFRVTLDAAGGGPLRDQLQDIGQTLDGGIARAWSTAQQGHRVSQARRRINTEAVNARLTQPPATQPGPGPAGPGPAGADPPDMDPADMDPADMDQTDGTQTDSEDAVGQALRAQLGSADRLDSVISAAEQQLRLLTTQLDEAVARAAELAARAGSGASLGTVAADITRVSDQLEALRLALEETDRL